MRVCCYVICRVNWNLTHFKPPATCKLGQVAAHSFRRGVYSKGLQFIGNCFCVDDDIIDIDLGRLSVR